jgi:hypothetical protein
MFLKANEIKIRSDESRLEVPILSIIFFSKISKKIHSYFIRPQKDIQGEHTNFEYFVPIKKIVIARF